MTQNQRLLAYLRQGHSVTPIDALRRFGILRLGARVYDLKAAGHDVQVELVAVTNRFGDSSRVARYSLKERAA